MDAGVSAALVHYLVASRESLLAEALEHSYEHAGAARIGGAVAGQVPAPERLRAMIDQCLPAPGELHDDWVLWAELWLRASRDAELRPIAARLYARLHEWFAEALRVGVESGELAAVDPDRMADRLLALIDGYGIRAMLADPAVPLELAREEIWAAVAGDLGV
jgi:AcrR family transcriptional regulator